MSTSHGLFIPDSSQISDIPSLLAYLGVLVYEFHECVYCGAAKGSIESVQTHMRDKGHCKIAEEEMRDFGCPDEEEGEGVKLKGNEAEGWKLQSGRMVTKKSDTARLRSTRHRVKKDEVRTITSHGNETQLPSRNTHDSHIALRSDVGLVGLSNQQRRAVMVTEKKMQTSAVIAEKKGRYRMVQAPVLTKYYKVCYPLWSRNGTRGIGIWRLTNELGRLRILCIRLDDEMEIEKLDEDRNLERNE
jgi:pre-60S factor REI1